MHQLCLNLNGLPRNGSDEIEYYLGMQATYSDILSDFSCISTIKILIVVVVVWTPLSASLLVKARCLDSSVSLLLAVSGEASFFPVLKLLIPVSCTLFLSQYPAFSPSQGLWYLWSLRPGFLCVWYCLWGTVMPLGQPQGSGRSLGCLVELRRHLHSLWKSASWSIWRLSHLWRPLLDFC